MPIQSTGFEGSLVISWNVGLSNRLTEKFKKTNCTYTRCKNPCLTITHVQESRGGCCDSCPRWGTNEMASSARRHQPHSTPGQPDHRCSSTLVRTLNQPPLEGNPADGCGSGKNMCHLLFLTLPLLPASPLEAGRSRYPCGNLLCTSGGPGDIFKISWCLLLCFQEGMPFPDTKQGWPGVSPALFLAGELPKPGTAISLQGENLAQQGGARRQKGPGSCWPPWASRAAPHCLTRTAYAWETKPCWLIMSCSLSLIQHVTRGRTDTTGMSRQARLTGGLKPGWAENG